ncbi:hypothetical protein ABZS29_28975 [Kribbella sp. NPDC005582]|uniref:hypothetical protein n=1 Tax=Kribbella sp. NPDC005582 TaxID=3156893 RepID=UPI0033AD81F6
MDYSQIATDAMDLTMLISAMQDISDKAQSGLNLLEPLSTSIQMWNAAGEGINTYSDRFLEANQGLMSVYRSTGDAQEYATAVRATQTALEVAGEAIGGGRTGGITRQIENAGRNLKWAADSVEAIRAAFAQDVQNHVATYGPVGNSTMGAAGTGHEQVLFEFHKPNVVRAGGLLNQLGTSLQQFGQTITELSGSLRWAGPGAGTTANAQGTAPGVTPGGVPGGVPGGTPTDTGAPPAQGAGTGADPGQTPGAGGEMPGGDTGLAGMPPTAPPPTMPPPVKLPPLQTPHLPGMPPPVAIPPIAPLPVRPGTGARGIGRIGGGGPGGIGGGIGGGPVKGGGGLKTGNGFQQIPRAGQQVSAAPAPSGGQAPVAPSGLTSGSGAGAGATGGGMPPMMPPMGGAGAGGGGRNGKGSPLRPVGRRRERRDEDTPGVPVGLRGRAGKDLPGAFPAVPANTRRRQDSGPSAETLQLLDEELWQVDETEATAPQATPRLSN